MRSLSVENLFSRARHVWASTPRKRFLFPAALLVGLILVVGSAGGLDEIKRFCDAILTDLDAFRPFAMASDFFSHYLACDTKFVSKVMGNLDYGKNVTTCEFTRYFSPLRNGQLFWEIVRKDFLILGLPGRIIMAVSLVVSFTWTALLLSAIWEAVIGRKLFLPITLLVAAILTPTVAGVVVFILQYFAIALLTVFGAIITLLLWLGTLFGALFGAWRFYRDVESVSKDLESAAGAVGVLTAPLAKPDDKPKAATDRS